MSDLRRTIVRAVCVVGLSAAVLPFVSAQQPYDTSLYSGKPAMMKASMISNDAIRESDGAFRTRER